MRLFSKIHLLFILVFCLLPACKAPATKGGSTLPPVGSGNQATAPRDEPPIQSTSGGSYSVTEPTIQDTKPIITYRGATN